MKRWKSLTAALCAAVLLCGFSAVPAFAYADGGEGEDYGDPTMTEETTAPEPAVPLRRKTTQGLPVLRVSLMAGHRLCLLLPGTSEGPGWREVRPCPASLPGRKRRPSAPWW